MLAFDNKPAVKKKYVDRVKAHYDADAAAYAYAVARKTHYKKYEMADKPIELLHEAK